MMPHEPLTEKEYELVSELCLDGSNAAALGRLTKWEGQFLEDISARLSEYGMNTLITEKQWEVIERLERKVFQV